MSKHVKSIALLFSALTVASVSGFSGEFDPVTLTFGEMGRDIGNQGPIVENGYQYEAVGASWTLQSVYGPDGNALLTFWGIPPALGNVTTFKRLDDSPFLFRSLELRGRLEGQRNDVVLARGFLDGAEVASQVLQSSNEGWRIEFSHSGFAAPIDLLQFELVEVNGAALMFDNLVLEPAPEPTTGALLAFGLSVSAWLRLGQSRTKTLAHQGERSLGPRLRGAGPEG